MLPVVPIVAVAVLVEPVVTIVAAVVQLVVPTLFAALATVVVVVVALAVGVVPVGAFARQAAAVRSLLHWAKDLCVSSPLSSDLAKTVAADFVVVVACVVFAHFQPFLSWHCPSD